MGVASGVLLKRLGSSLTRKAKLEGWNQRCGSCGDISPKQTESLKGSGGDGLAGT